MDANKTEQPTEQNTNQASEPKTIKTTRDFKAIAVPFGHEVDVPKDTEVIILQALGGTYTIIAGGQTLRVDQVNADALGLEVDAETTEFLAYISDQSIPLKDRIWAQLKTCYDPEIPVNIVDLGLIYEVKIELLSALSSSSDAAMVDGVVTVAADGIGHADSPTKAIAAKVVIRMTLTAPGCGMGPIIAAEAKQKVLEVPGVKEVEVVMVFDPPWDRSRLSDEAKLSLGLM